MYMQETNIVNKNNRKSMKMFLLHQVTAETYKVFWLLAFHGNNTLIAIVQK